MATQDTTSVERDGGKDGGDSAPPSLKSPTAAVESPRADTFPTSTSGSSAPTTPATSAFRPGVQHQGIHAHRMSRQHATETSLNTAYHGAVIPPNTPYRTLVLCFDGTGDAFDSDNSNVVQLFSMLKKGDKNQQLVYYQAGIGTYTIPQIATPFYSKLAKTIDLMFASNLNHHVMGGYEFLMENYREGDKICIFGFSRGAYTARALAGMVHKVGLLPNSNHQQVPFAYRMYMNDDETGWKQSVLFKKTFSIDVDIEFVGVWDTVASVGLFPRRLPFTKSNTAIKTFRHAMSLDEHRAKFRPNTYQKTTLEEALRGDFVAPKPESITRTRPRPHHTKHNSKAILEDLVHAAKVGADAVKRAGSSHSPNGKEKEEDGDERRKRLEEMYTDRSRPTDVLEVWFAGCHCDVGGGSVPNDTRHSLARIPLRWMIRQCFLTNSGIQFEADKLREIAGIDPATLYPFVLPRPAPLEIPRDLASSVSLMNYARSGTGGVGGVGGVGKEEGGEKTGEEAVVVVVSDDLEKVEQGVIVESPQEKRTSSMEKNYLRSASESESGSGDGGRRRDVDLDSIASAPSSLGGADSSSSSPGDQKRDKRHHAFVSEEEEDLFDALSPIYDQLKLSKPWWALELLPMKLKMQREDGTWRKSIEMNMGRPRVLPDQKKHGIKVHRSVKMRMEAHALKYKPRLRIDVDPEWVD